MQNILVTGGLGFIGSHYVRLLHRSGYDVIIIDRMSYAADINRIKDIVNELDIDNKLYIVDICDNQLYQIIERHNIDCIVNFAASTHVDRSIENSRDFIYDNFIGVHNLLEMCRKYDLRVVQVSTDEVYGSIKKGSFKETDILSPGNPYSATKASADLLCLSYYNTYKSDIVITRSSNNYGPFQYPEKFIPRMIALGNEGKPLTIYGDGTNVRDWLYVEDNCIGIKLVMEKGKNGEIYNIAGENEFANNWIAKMISTKFNIPIEYIVDRPGHDFRYSINCDKIKKELGWKSEISFEKGLEKTIDLYIDQK